MKKVILVTGVSSGFGKHTASLLAKAGHTVYGTFRKPAEIDPFVHPIQMDLTKSDSMLSAINEIMLNEGRIDILINNAGMHSGGPVETLPIETIKLQMDTNFLGMVQLTKAVLPIMRKQRSGTIINFGSIGGLMGLPFQAFYSASKFAVEGFSEALRMEVIAFNIKVIVINPGDFNTSNSLNRRGFLAPSDENDLYQTQFAQTLSIIEKDEAKGWSSEILAKKIVKIVECKNPKQRYIIASFGQKLAVGLKYILPAKIFRRILEEHYGIKKSTN